MRTLSSREGRLVALALLVAALALGWLVLIQPILSGFVERAHQRDELRTRYEANERLIARIPSLRRMAEEQAGRATAFVLVAPDPEQGGEILRQRLEESLVRSGGELRASEVLEADAGWVRASIAAAMSHEQMASWLQHLRTEPPYLAIDALTVTADRAMNSNHIDLLDVQIEATIPLAPAYRR